MISHYWFTGSCLLLCKLYRSIIYALCMQGWKIMKLNFCNIVIILKDEINCFVDFWVLFSNYQIKRNKKNLKNLRLYWVWFLFYVNLVQTFIVGEVSSCIYLFYSSNQRPCSYFIGCLIRYSCSLLGSERKRSYFYFLVDSTFTLPFFL